MTKGNMIKALKAAGVRKADKEGTRMRVSLEHLKTAQVTNLYFKYCR